ncbi:MAG: alpha/beta fold hydrolase [Spongiibacteraceae bacterium]|nr:alpha/beta fold hydrolase [Spongiibacteraceae bacterium]
MGEGQPLILLHGLFGMGVNLSMVAKPMSEHFQVTSLDLRNHGTSFWASSMSFTEMAEDVLRFMDHAGITQAHILGHSLGGKVAMQLALNHPQRVNKLIVADIAPVAYRGNHDKVFEGIGAIDVTAMTPRRDAQTILEQYIDEEGERLFLLKSLYRTEQGHFAWRLNVEALERCYPQLREGVTAEQAFAGPTLFIKGENSPYIIPEYQEVINGLFSDVSFKMIQNTGHWLHAEKTAAFNRIVGNFLLA